jgi:ABC-type branched-subunit amino acid transport system substrate-binding protein
VTPETPSVMTAYDAVKIIAESLTKTRGEGGEKLQKEISSIKNYKGVSLNNISFDEIGFVKTPKDSWEIKTVKNGEFVRAE